MLLLVLPFPCASITYVITDHENPRQPHESNRHGKSKSSWRLSSAVHGVGFVAKKVISNRYTDSIWHSKKTSSSASDVPDAKRENVADDEQTQKLPVSTDLGQDDCTDVVDESENTKPTDVKPVNQHRWPSGSRTSDSNVVKLPENTKPTDSSHARPVGSNVVKQSDNLEPADGSHAKPVNLHRWPGTVGSNFLNKGINHAYGAGKALNLKKKSFPHDANNKPLPESSSDATDSSNVKPSPVVRGPSVTPATRSASDTSTTRGVSPSPATRGVSPSPATTDGSPIPTVRGSSPTPTIGVGPSATDVSPTLVKPSKPSSRRHFFNANILSVFTKIVDNRKEKNLENLKEVAQHLELLYNIQVQWQFANASAEAALDLQRETAEKSLSDMWRAILELRDSLASKKIDIDLLILQLKLYAVLYRQMAYIDEWGSIQKEHESALFATTNDLQARSLSLPLTGGVKADIKGLKLIVFSTIQVLQATVSCIQSTVSKLDKTHVLASELANLVLHERALLDECEIFLSSAAPLHIEECSLRSFILQSNRTSMTE